MEHQTSKSENIEKFLVFLKSLSFYDVKKKKNRDKVYLEDCLEAPHKSKCKIQIKEKDIVSVSSWGLF